MSNPKLNASIEAIDYIKPKITAESIIGVGTGSTVNYFIDELAKVSIFLKALFPAQRHRQNYLKTMVLRFLS